MAKRYKISDEEKKQFAGIYVLEYMINKPCKFPLLLSENDQDIEPILEWLLVKDYIAIVDKEYYVPTEKGRRCLSNFMKRYSEFLHVFDIYCAVDLEAGEFAFDSYFDFDDRNRWREYLEDERWDDLRVSVVDYKKLNPAEIVFMSFISENRFGRDEVGWQFDLLLGTVWDEILDICNTAIQWEQLGYEDENGPVPAEKVIEDIIVQGAELILQLHHEEVKLAPKYLHDYEENQTNGEVRSEIDKVAIENHAVSYYNPYLDPGYVSPCFGSRWLI